MAGGSGKTSILKEFQDFAIHGSALDLAIGVVIGGAFSTIVTSLVSDIITPLLSLVLGRFDLTNRFWTLSGGHYASLAAAKAAGAVTLNYGTFLNDVLDFLIIAVCIFLLVREVNRIKRRSSPVEPPTLKEKVCPFCLQTVPLQATKCAFCTSNLPA